MRRRTLKNLQVVRSLPWREEILRGVLACDLIGFHTPDYARHFRSACTRILGLQSHTEVGTVRDIMDHAVKCSRPQGIHVDGRFAAVGAFPIGVLFCKPICPWALLHGSGIDPERFLDAMKTIAVQRHALELSEQFRGKKV